MKRSKTVRMNFSALLLLLSLWSVVFPIPCGPAGDNNAHERFKSRHVVSRYFEVNSKDAWEKHLETLFKKEDRPPVQHFFTDENEKKLNNVCRQEGVRYGDQNSNNCLSEKTFTVWEVTSKKDSHDRLKVSKVEHLENRHVILGCVTLNNVCSPNHYQGMSNNVPNPNAAKCQPEHPESSYWPA